MIAHGRARPCDTGSIGTVVTPKRPNVGAEEQAVDGSRQGRDLRSTTDAELR